MAAERSYSNGSYVSRAELSAHLEPLREDMQEIRDDVKALLAFMNGFRAIFRTVAVTAGVLGGLGGFGYLIAYIVTGN